MGPSYSFTSPRRLRNVCVLQFRIQILHTVSGRNVCARQIQWKLPSPKSLSLSKTCQSLGPNEKILQNCDWNQIVRSDRVLLEVHTERHTKMHIELRKTGTKSGHQAATNLANWWMDGRLRQNSSNRLLRLSGICILALLKLSNSAKIAVWPNLLI